ncbi:MAG: hypothetical protein AAGA48_26995 [Myxococcota bacterium]
MVRFVWMIAFLAACDATGESCVDGELSCDSTGLILQDCVDGQAVEQQNCETDGLECHADMGTPHCGPAGMGDGMGDGMGM